MPPKSVPFKLATCKCKYRCHDLVENEVPYPDSNIHQRFYRRVFRKSFPKLSFHRPRTDTCSSCDLLKNKINTTVGLEKLKLIAKKELHLRKAENAVKLLNEGNASSRMPSSGTCPINMDMQQVHPLSHTPVCFTAASSPIPTSAFTMGIPARASCACGMRAWLAAEGMRLPPVF
ncbi:uncharacterized protein TNCV_1847491 [Trichonephila clavipes]|nr:uncharacterized protein TNCV_1847491 [Trichonephila clavipes]